ncbi:MAG: IclR family transcriptional regulator [Natronomonas sp.]
MGETGDEVQSVEKMFRIVEHLRSEDGCSITSVARDLDLAKSTTHRHLRTLEAASYVVEEDGLYYPSLKFLRLGEYTRQRKQTYDIAAPVVEDIAAETGERVQFIVEEHNTAVTTHFATGERAVLTDTQLGQRLPLHSTSAGKAILSQYPDDELDRVIDSLSLHEETPATITDPAALRREVRDDRRRGYSFNDEEYIEGLRGISAPIVDEKNGVRAALTISGPVRRFTGEWFHTELPETLLGYVNEIELKITYPE